ncbi:MAG: hypothetical protein GF393_12715 [Armatimonadia bacterium]|nr:hypothetical protein [Armatimonadia bacterium]
MLEPEVKSLIRGMLQVTFALLAAASFGGWVVLLGMFVGVTVDMGVIQAAFWAITVLYGLLALAAGNAMGRRQGKRGMAAAALGALLSWAILELFFYLYQIGSAEMRVPLIAGVALSTVGAAVGTMRRADRDALRVELEEEMQELEREEDEEPFLEDEASTGSQTNGKEEQ